MRPERRTPVCRPETCSEACGLGRTEADIRGLGGSNSTLAHGTAPGHGSGHPRPLGGVTAASVTLRHGPAAPRPHPRRPPSRLTPPACDNARALWKLEPDAVPVLATFFSVRRGRDPFFKFFMRKVFPRQVKRYEDEFGMRFLGWYNVAYGWDFDNVILLELPDYATIDKLEGDERGARRRPSRRRVDVRAPSLDVPPRADGTPTSNTTREHRDDQATTADEHLTTQPRPRRRSSMDEHEQRPGRDRRRGEPRAQRLPGRRRRAAHRFLDANKRPDQGDRRPGPDRRRPRLPVGRAGRLRSARAPATRTRSPGEWHSETEVIESAAELVELYNPAEVFAAFAEAAREQAGLPARADRYRRPAWTPPASRPRRRSASASAATSSPTRATPAPPTTGRARQADSGEPRRRRRRRAPPVRPGAHLPGAQPALRGATDRAVRDGRRRSLRPCSAT